MMPTKVVKTMNHFRLNCNLRFGLSRFIESFTWANGRNHGERANELQADEKTDHPFSRAFHGSPLHGRHRRRSGCGLGRFSFDR